VAVIQQTQIAAQESQISSQQQEVALFVKQNQPFVNGQAASLVIGQGGYTSYGSQAFEAGYVGLSSLNYSLARLNSPTEVLFDPSGNLWVVDAESGRILEFEPPFSTGLSASVTIRADSEPTGAAFDASGNLWLVDSGYHRIIEFVPPFISGMLPSHVIGQKILGTNFSSASNSGFFMPRRVSFDRSGDMWVLDSGNNRVLEFKPPFTDGMNASIVIGQQGFGRSSPATTRSALDAGFGDLAFDPSGALWVGDANNNRILEFVPPFSTGMNASLVLGQPNFTASIPLRNPIPWMSFYAPNSGIPPMQSLVSHIVGITNLGNALIFDLEGDLWASYNSRIVEFTPPFGAGMQPTLELGQPDFTSSAWVGGKAGLAVPSHPAFDSSGDIWVPDIGNNRVLEFASANSPLSIVSGQTSPGFFQVQWVEGGVAIVLAGACLVAYSYLRIRRGTLSVGRTKAVRS
jgi:hypothetical protein